MLYGLGCVSGLPVCEAPFAYQALTGRHCNGHGDGCEVDQPPAASDPVPAGNCRIAEHSGLETTAAESSSTYGGQCDFARRDLVVLWVSLQRAPFGARA